MHYEEKVINGRLYRYVADTDKWCLVCGSKRVTSRLLKAEQDKSDLLEALKGAHKSFASLNGSVSLEVWDSLFEPMKAIRRAIAKAEVL